MRAPRSPFARLAPASEDYASRPVAEAFTWDRCAGGLDEGEWYLVAFRSILRGSADLARLWEHDRRAHQEARRSPGFVHYFKGLPNERGECLSFCIWDTRRHAREAAGGSAHLEAIALVHEIYESYVLEFLRVTKRGSGELTFEPYDPIPSGAPEAAVIPAG